MEIKLVFALLLSLSPLCQFQLVAFAVYSLDSPYWAQSEISSMWAGACTDGDWNWPVWCQVNRTQIEADSSPICGVWLQWKCCRFMCECNVLSEFNKLYICLLLKYTKLISSHISIYYINPYLCGQCEYTWIVILIKMDTVQVTLFNVSIKSWEFVRKLDRRHS